MAILSVTQPELIVIREDLRLRKYDGHIAFALEWYQDEELVYLVDGKRESYSMERLRKMYEYLDEKGELYFIEIWKDSSWQPIGDVTFWQHDMPIVIGDRDCRSKGIGRAVITALIERARELGYTEIYVEEIYPYNIASRKCFESVGFLEYKKSEAGIGYRLNIIP